MDAKSPGDQKSRRIDTEKQKKREDGASFTRQIARMGKVTAQMAGAGARVAGAQLFSRDPDRAKQANILRETLGELKGPLVKVAQALSSVPEFLPPEFAVELSRLQANAPPMDAEFVQRRMLVELGEDWQSHFAQFDFQAAAAASLGQVHKAQLHDGRAVALKLQYEDMQSAIAADLKQLGVLLMVADAIENALDTSLARKEVAERLREELDYIHEAKVMRLYGLIFAEDPRVQVPRPVSELSTIRLLTMDWLEGAPLVDVLDRPLEARNALARTMFDAWWQPLAKYGVVHGDAHLGNYTVRPDLSVNLLDFGCARVFTSTFVAGVKGIYSALQSNNREAMRAACIDWGFGELPDDQLDVVMLWASAILKPMLDDRVRTLADGVDPTQFGRAEFLEARNRLKKTKVLKIPREFVFLERAMIGLGAVFMHLQAEQNWHNLFNEALDGFDADEMETAQARVMQQVGLDRHALRGDAKPVTAAQLTNKDNERDRYN